MKVKPIKIDDLRKKKHVFRIELISDKKLNYKEIKEEILTLVDEEVRVRFMEGHTR